MRQKIIVLLKGGFGNQLFQYAAARSLALSENAELVVDDVSGFSRDKMYRRTYELGALNLPVRRARFAERVPFLIEQLASRLKLGFRSKYRRPWGVFLGDNSLKGYLDSGEIKKKSNIWMEGYFQSAGYFEKYESEIKNELNVPPPKNPQVNELAKKIAATESVCIGVRLFEEVAPSAVAASGGITPVEFYRAAIRELPKTARPYHFFVFCTKDDDLERKLDLPQPVTMVTHDQGIDQPLDSLYLMTKCKWHVISNSTFYWWGAWLAHETADNRRVIAADTFPDKDTIPVYWKKFGYRRL
jgi:hypothetical protein